MYEIRLQSYRQIIKIQQRNTVLSRSLEGKFIRHISSRVPSIWILNRQNSNDDLIEFFGLSKLSSIARKMAACIIWHPPRLARQHAASLANNLLFPDVYIEANCTALT